MELLAPLPLVAAVLAIFALRMPGWAAGIVGLAVALVLTGWVPDFELDIGARAIAVVNGALTTVSVAYVLLGGIALFVILDRGGALAAIGPEVARRLPRPATRILVMIYGVSVFFESATGFGVGIIVCAPLFLAAGMSALQAAKLALLGQCAVTWGALAVGTTLGAELSGIESRVIGTRAALLGFPAALLCGAAALRVAGERLSPSNLLGLGFWCGLSYGSLYVATLLVDVELAGLLAGLVVTFAGVAPHLSGRSEAPARLLRAVAPFAVLVVSLLATRLVPHLGALTASTAVVQIPRFDFQLAVVHHPGFWLLVSAAVALLLADPAGRRIHALAGLAATRWVIATTPVAGFLAMAAVMSASGMLTSLAGVLAGAFAGNVLYAVPLIGALGGFLTASNAGSNAMFMKLHMALASQAGLDPGWTAAAQNAAASNITLASPGRVVLAATVAGSTRDEQPLLRFASLVGLAGLLALCAVLALLGA